MIDPDRIAELESAVEPVLELRALADIDRLPFTSHEEFRQLVEADKFSLGVEYKGELAKTNLFTPGEAVAHHVWAALPFVCCAGFIVAAILTRRYILLLGVLTTMTGFILSTPYSQGCTKPLLGLSWMPALFFAFTGRLTWTIVIAGFYFGYMFAATAREQFRMVIERLALSSEPLACYFLQSGMLHIRDNARGEELL